MRNEKFNILILIFTILIFGCEQKVEPKRSEFKVAQDYSEFKTEMENNDTLNIGVVLSMCMWSEYDQLQITKTNDSVFLQLKEKRVMDDEPVHFGKVVYELKNDSLNLEKMMTDFDINYQEEISSPFFIINNPKEKDTILLRTTGLGNRGFNIERYQRIMFELYPKEMEKYRLEYMVPPPELIEIKENEME
jgi:Fe-S cluster assembly iron-binding protein IscA